MSDRSPRPLYSVLLLILLAGCATTMNTPQQDYVWEQVKVCDTRTATLRVSRVSNDGKLIWWQPTLDATPQIPVYLACLREQYALHPYLDWIKARQGTSVAALSAPSVPTPVSNSVTMGPIMAPVWRVGDEWEYAYKSPSDSGTYVWSVNRVEMLAGVQQYVIKAGTREILYRASDLAFSVERVDSVVTMRETPPRPLYSWPLTVGQRWEQTTRLERPVDSPASSGNGMGLYRCFGCGK